MLVGTTSRMRDMIALLEVTVPDFFKGALGHFDSLDGKRVFSFNQIIYHQSKKK